MFKKKGNDVVIDFDGSYPEFKLYKEKNWTQYNPAKERSENLLTFRTVLYVLYKGQPYKMFVSNASSAGVDADGRPSFDKPQEKSFQSYEKRCRYDGKRSV